MKTLLFIGLIFFPFLFFAQEQTEELDDFERVKKSTLSWADSTFHHYDGARFEHFRADYTDEYLIASMRVKSIERSIKSLNKTYSSGYYNGTDEAYFKSIEDLEARKVEAEMNSVDFQPKVDHFQVAFWANIKLDSGIHNYIKHDVILNNDFKVIHTQITGTIGENKNATIIYR